ncbi:hypothetical protein [Cellulosimicrobium sp. CUA-896]|uniref:hypothetical protein n=1 Tax=Cellulosimicrobium sp. CUA-896 TaxID=1517881 RepID=UPI00095A2D77|nr:hypothetical protein [Cellulosimicrobium sp. CUA-896]OLT49492.1 hypothetical protein BJF88_16185 [Cellulosimicrobium sp. CUA-896]
MSVASNVIHAWDASDGRWHAYAGGFIAPLALALVLVLVLVLKPASLANARPGAAVAAESVQVSELAAAEP